MKINTQSISHREGLWLKIDEAIQTEAMPLDFEGYVLQEPIVLHAYLLNTGEATYRLSGSIETGFTGCCARCLRPVGQKVESTISDVFALSGHGAHAGKEALGEDDEDVEEIFYPYRGHEIDITQALRDDLLLALPPRVFCSENCKGLCPQCGQNLNEKACDCTGEAAKSPSPFDRLQELL